MSPDYRKRLLTRLVDWYEDSAAYIRGQVPARRRIMRLYENGQTDFADYDIENYLVRRAINQAVLDLDALGYIAYRWMRGEQDHILAQVWLNFDELDSIYAYLHRRPKGDAVDDVLQRLAQLKESVAEAWAQAWVEDTLSAISKKRAIGATLPEDEADREDLFKAVAALANRKEIEILERLFSIQCFGHSKRFERSVKPRLVRILKKYIIQDDCPDEDALRAVGIVRYPEPFEFSGALSMVLPKGVLHFSYLPYGGTLTSEDIQQGSIFLDPAIRRILSIENRANYMEYIHKYRQPDELVLFHGGPFSPAKNIFLRAVISAMPEACVFHHWGDIDYGGFQMLARLRREILPGVKAWRMDEESLQTYAAYTDSFSEAYGKKLASLLERPELHDCVPCLEYMLTHHVRLEQEALLME